jgi:hypothetical protein
LLKCVFHDLLQIKPISRGLRKLAAVLLDLAHVEQQRGQGPVQLSCDRGSRLIHHARGGQPDNFQIVVDRGVLVSSHFGKCESLASWCDI